MRVVTLNLWGDRAPLEDRLAAAGAGLAAVDPDVVLLQEVRCGEGLENTAVRLAALLGPGYAASYSCATAGPAGTWGPGSKPGEEGLAMVTKHPVAQTVTQELPEARPDERRILLSARVEIAGRAVWCHTTHLHWRLADGAAREQQVLAIDDAIRGLGTGTPHVLGGDFNAAPDCDEIRFLSGRHSLGGRRTYWQDAFNRARPEERGWTWARRNPGIMKWLEPDRRIDYVFVSPERRDGTSRVLDARVLLDEPTAAGIWPSDHFAVLADIA